MLPDDGHGIRYLSSGTLVESKVLALFGRELLSHGSTIELPEETRAPASNLNLAPGVTTVSLEKPDDLSKLTATTTRSLPAKL